MKSTCIGSYPQSLDQTLRTCDGGSKLLGNQFTVKSVVWNFSTSISCEMQIIIKFEKSETPIFRKLKERISPKFGGNEQETFQNTEMGRL